MQLRQGGHVVHALLVPGVHGERLLLGDRVLLVREHLRGGDSQLLSDSK